MTVRAFPALLVLLVVGGVVPAGTMPAGTMPAACAAEGAADAPAAEVTKAEAPQGAPAGEKTDGFLSYEETETYPQGSFAGLMLRLVLSMAVILGLIYGGLLLFRFLARKAKVAPKSEKLIRIIDRTALDPKRAIYLVKVVDRLLVIGVGTNDVCTLAQIDDETVVENVQETEFTGHLQSLLGRLAGRQS